MLMDSFVKKAFRLFTVHLHYGISPVRQKEKKSTGESQNIDLPAQWFTTQEMDREH